MYLWLYDHQHHRMPKSTAKSHRLRTGRCSLENQIYHVTSATIERRNIFDSLYVARYLVRAMQRETARGQVSTFAYVVMPDHFHWLLQLTTGGSLSRTLNNVKAGSTRSINRFLGRQGSVWQKGYFDRALRSDEDLKSVARYIIANPIRAGIVRQCGDYPLWDAKWV